MSSSLLEGLMAIYVSGVLGFTMKLADLFNEHGLKEYLDNKNKIFKGNCFRIPSGVAWGLLTIPIISLHEPLFFIFFALILSFILRQKIDCWTHIIGTFLFFGGFIYYSTVEPNMMAIKVFHNDSWLSNRMNLMFIFLIVFTFLGIVHDLVMRGIEKKKINISETAGERLHSALCYILFPFILFNLALFIFLGYERDLLIICLSLMSYILGYEIVRAVWLLFKLAPSNKMGTK